MIRRVINKYVCQCFCISVLFATSVFDHLFLCIIHSITFSATKLWLDFEEINGKNVNKNGNDA